MTVIAEFGFPADLRMHLVKEFRCEGAWVVVGVLVELDVGRRRREDGVAKN